MATMLFANQSNKLKISNFSLLLFQYLRIDDGVSNEPNAIHMQANHKLTSFLRYFTVRVKFLRTLLVYYSMLQGLVRGGEGEWGATQRFHVDVGSMDNR